ncbi:hypothetical protein [Oceaniferula spumae]
MKTIITLLLCLAVYTQAEDKVPSSKKEATVSGLTIEKLPLPQAIKVLNTVISKEHPRRQDLLVAYVEAPHLDKIIPAAGNDPRKVNLKLANNPPITTVVQYMCDQTRCQWRTFGTLVVIYGWPRGNIEAVPAQE